MNNLWTGGQYSIVRAILGAVLLVLYAGTSPLRIAFTIATVLFIVGFQDRIAVVVMVGILVWLDGPTPWLLLLVHAFLPPAPYGSIDGRKRVDPRWRPSPLLAPLTLVVPVWIPRREPGTTDTLFYDGTCGLCHRAVRFLLSEDASGSAFRFAPLGGDAFREVLGDGAGLPDSMIVKTAAGEVLTKSDAALHVGGRLGGLWRLFAWVVAIVPRALRDRAYDFIASIRYRLFERPKDACPMLPPDLRARFSG